MNQANATSANNGADLIVRDAFNGSMRNIGSVNLYDVDHVGKLLAATIHPVCTEDQHPARVAGCVGWISTVRLIKPCVGQCVSQTTRTERIHCATLEQGWFAVVRWRQGTGRMGCRRRRSSRPTDRCPGLSHSNRVNSYNYPFCAKPHRRISRAYGIHSLYNHDLANRCYFAFFAALDSGDKFIRPGRHRRNIKRKCARLNGNCATNGSRDMR